MVFHSFFMVCSWFFQRTGFQRTEFQRTEFQRTGFQETWYLNYGTWTMVPELGTSNLVPELWYLNYAELGTWTLVPELWYLNLVPELLGLGVLGYSDPLGLGVPDCLLGLRVLGVLGSKRLEPCKIAKDYGQHLDLLPFRTSGNLKFQKPRFTNRSPVKELAFKELAFKELDFKELDLKNWIQGTGFKEFDSKNWI